MGELVEKVKAAGVIGAGGAGFPTHVKYQAGVEYVIANGAECEPLLHCDQGIMAGLADRVVEGVELVMKEVGAKAAFIALKKKYTAPIASLEKALAGKRGMYLHLLDNFYPAGDEQVMVFEVLGRVVPEGGIPLNVGVVVNNVATFANVAAASEGKSVTRRWLTVHGEVKSPSTFEVPVGISVREAITLAGGPLPKEYRVILGGPMMGSVIDDLETPVTKTTSGIILLASDHPLIERKTLSPNGILKRSKAACDQCMHCTELCPRYLIGHAMKPHMIMKALPYGISDSSIITSAYLCCECGLCSYFACPLFLAPGAINSMLKAEMSRSGVKNPHRRSQLEPYPARKERRVPTARLVERIGLAHYYHVPAPVREISYKPERVRIPLKQHLGAPALPVIQAGAKVKTGDLLGEIPGGALGARVHASIDGYVHSIDKEVVIERA